MVPSLDTREASESVAAMSADSASTVLGQMPDGQLGVINVYNNATKVFNLREGLPIEAITWGVGSIGKASISTIIKDLRQAFSGHGNLHSDWKLDPTSYTVTLADETSAAEPLKR